MIRTLFHSWIHDTVAVTVFLLLVAVFFHPVLLEGKIPVPTDALVGLYHPWRDLYRDTNPRGIPFKNFLITDPVRQLIPWRKIAVDQWKQGIVPLWNPYNFSGNPMLANIQAATLYPLNILFFVFPFIDAWTIVIILQPLLAGLFMYWYLRFRALNPIASLLGAVSWSFSGFNVAWLTWGTIGHVALWLPLTLHAVDNIFIKHSFARWRKTVFWALILVFSLVTQFFAGHTQISFYFVFVVVGYGTMRILQSNERKKSTLIYILLLSFVALLTAIQWVPLLGWIRDSGRITESISWSKEGWFIPWAHLVQFVVPDFFGNPATLNYWGQWNYGEFVGYIGVLPLVFAVLAFLFTTSNVYRFWMGILIVCLLFAFPTPIAMIPYILKIPIISTLQPTRLLFVIDFALAVLAAYGCQEFLENKTKRPWLRSIMFVSVVVMVLWSIVAASQRGLVDATLRASLEVSAHNLIMPTVILFVSCLLLIVYQRLKHIQFLKIIIPWGFVALVALDLYRFGWKFTPFTPREYFFPESKVISFFKHQPLPFRIMSVDKRILPPNTASYFGIESIEGYDPIIASRYEELMAAIARGKPDVARPFGFNRIITLDSLHSSLLPMFNVKYILSLSDLSEPYLKKVFEEGETRVYEDLRMLPRVWTVEEAIRTSEKDETMRALYSVKDFRRAAVVEGDVSILSVPMRSDESISLITYQTNRLNIETSLSVPRLLVVSNAYDPGWRATIDGNKTQIYRTNYSFQGVVVPQGSHTVTFSYAL